jgi:CheY-like chemotaxis protein
MPERATILIAEDEEDDILLLTYAFSQAGIDNPVHFVRTGPELVSYLKGDGKYFNRDEYPLPELLLLDLKLPGYNGFEVLAWVRSHPGLMRLRIVVLTSSNQETDVNKAYRLGANSFLVKPDDFDGLVWLAKLIQQTWLEHSKSPESFRTPPPAQFQNQPPASEFTRPD